jgi:riboflavin kinase/FMN adenylyltransferase
MLHHTSLQDLHLQDVWLTIGSFDGVHRGHQAILRKLIAGAHAVGAPAVVLTFFPHPSIVLRGRSGPFYLTTPEERAALLGELGVDRVVTLPFDRELASQTARQFVQALVDHLGLRHLCIGHDFALGRDRQGDLPYLQNLGREMGFTVHVMKPIRLQGEVVSSSRIRAALAQGNVRLANALLGRRYQVQGQVVPGDGRGRTIGIPTANLEVWSERLLPKTGVYACLACVDGQVQRAVANIGVRPTFEHQDPTPRLEAHLLDYDRDLYGKTISVSFVSRLRDEQRFSSASALVEQIGADIRQARRLLRVKDERW